MKANPGLDQCQAAAPLSFHLSSLLKEQNKNSGADVVHRTVRMNHARGALTASISPRKRKDREDSFIRVKQVEPHPSNRDTTSLMQKPAEPGWSNRLIAGHLAHEFLTQGTLLGQKFDPARAEAVPLFVSADLKKKPAASGINSGSSVVEGAEPSAPATVQLMKSYAVVAHLLKTDGSHIPGIVNPTQLARWIQR